MWIKNLILLCVLLCLSIGAINVAEFAFKQGHTYIVGSVVHKMYSYEDNEFYVTLNDNIKYNVDKNTYVHASLGQECVISSQNDKYLPIFILAVVGVIVFWVLFILYCSTNWDSENTIS